MPGAPATCIINAVSKLAIIIPARKGSSRFPGKVIHPICGVPLVAWVAKGASTCTFADRVIVATDDSEVADVVRDSGFEVAMTRKDHPSGTDRVWEVAESIETDWVLNLQGDEPLITGDVLDDLARCAFDGGDDGPGIITLVRKLDPSEADDPNRVKVVVDNEMNALYFSRSRIPYVKNDTGDDAEYYLNVGLYLFRKSALEKFVGLPQGKLEKCERLEQLRALENRMSIRCVLTDHEFLGVDTESDVARVENAMKSRDS